MRTILLICFLIFSGQITAEPVGECEGAPQEAVMELPRPINEWGVIVCTPYGHLISNKEGWIWSNPGSYSPVMIPSQMVRSNPEALGNKSFFTEISLKKIQGKEASAAIEFFERGFDKSPSIPNVYSMKVVSVSGREHGFQFFEYEDHQWGMWCNKECDPESSYMSKKPNNAN